MRKKKIIEVDRQQYEATYISKGQFSKVYRVGDRAVMYTRGDCAKEVVAMFQYERIAHLPELIRHENVTTRSGIFWYVFSSPYYRNVTIKNRSAYELMLKIVELYVLYRREFSDHRTPYNVYFMQGFSGFIRHEVPYSVVKALETIVGVASNCGEEVGFDFHRRNFGVNKYGTLILRDVFFVRS